MKTNLRKAQLFGELSEPVFAGLQLRLLALGSLTVSPIFRTVPYYGKEGTSADRNFQRTLQATSLAELYLYKVTIFITIQAQRVHMDAWIGSACRIASFKETVST